MVFKELRNGDGVDLERGSFTEDDDRYGARIQNHLVIRVNNGPISEEPVAGPPEREETQDLTDENLDLEEQKAEAEKKKKKKGGRKPPKPPRPTRGVSLDAADQKVIQQISELAMMKRARIERMKAVLRMKNSRPSFLSSNFWPLLVTILLCVLILWQGIFSILFVTNLIFLENM